MTTVAQVQLTPISVPLHTPFVTALRRTETTDTLVVRVHDSDGRIGWGEAPQVWQVTGESIASATACIESMIGPALVGLCLDDDEAFARSREVVQRCVARNFAAKAALDTALHDLVAQARGVSVASLLAGAGPVHEVRTDVTVSAGDAHALAATARARVAEGFTTLKLKIGTDAAHDLARVRAVREAVGSGVALRLDANQGWTRDEAVTVIRGLADAQLDIELVEQPIVADDVEGMAWVRERVDIPVMADESCWSPWDLERIIRLGAADSVNIKLAKCGSLAVGVAMLRRAHEAGLGTMVGSMMETHIGVAAAASVACAAGTSQVPDLDAGWWSRRPAVVGGIEYHGTELRWSDHPGSRGLGIRALA